MAKKSLTPCTRPRSGTPSARSCLRGTHYILLRNTVYFDGHGIGQALTVLLAYAVITAAILVLLDWYRSPELSVPGVDQYAAASTAAVAAPVGPLP